MTDRPAKTIREIKAPALNLTIPVGTEFIVCTDSELGYFTCENLGITSVWRNEFEFTDISVND